MRARSNRLLRWLLCLAPLTVSACHVAPKPLRVMTWNIHHGRGIDGRVDLERIAAVIRESGADIVALQEVDVGTRRTDRRDLAAELGELCGMTPVFRKNIEYQGGEYGNAMLSRLPIAWIRNHHYDMLRAGEQRGLLQAGMKWRGRDLAFLVTHIDYRPDDSERVANVAEIERIVAALDADTIVLCGDFNDTPGSRTHVGLRRHFGDCWEITGTGPGLTYPSGGARKRIDYVFVSGAAALEPVSAWIPVTTASDHLPLVVELR